MRPGPRLVVVLSIALIGAGSVTAGADQSERREFAVGPQIPAGIETVVQPDTISNAEFADPPMWARPQAYWLEDRAQTVAESKRQLALFKQAGLGGVTIQPGGPLDSIDTAGPSIDVPAWPMPHLSDEWFAYMDELLSELDRLGMTMYLPDVPFTPSGGARGRVSEPAKGGDPSLGWTTLDEVVPGQVYEPVTRPYWIDPLNPKAVARYIEVNYKLHKDKLGDHFGDALQAMWSDEVSFSPTASPNSFRYPFPRFPEIPWSASFPSYFKDRWGYDLTPTLLGKIFTHNPADPEGRRVSHDYWESVSARFADVYYGGLSRWSTDNGVGFIGQLLAEETTDQHFITEGSYFRASAQATIASTDLITGATDVPGAPFCDGQGCYGLTMKMISSSSHLFDRKRTHIEFLDITHAEIKDRPAMLRAMVDHAVARGINSFAPHSYDYAGGGYSYGNPLFEMQRPMNDYIGRLSYLFSHGRNQPDLAIGYAPEAFWVGDTWDNDVVALTAARLDSAQYEYDHVPVELFDDPGLKIGNGSFTYKTQTYRGLVVPDWHVASLSVVNRVADFVRRGGTLAVTGRLPRLEARGDDAALSKVTRQLFGFDPAAPPSTATTNTLGSGMVIWVPGDFTQDMANLTPARVAALDPLVASLKQSLSPRITVTGDPTLPSGLSAVATYPYHRAGADQYLVTNFPSWREKGLDFRPGSFGHAFESQPVTVTVEVPATGAPEIWDAETGERTRLWTYQVTAEGTLRIPLSLPAFGARLRRRDPAIHPRKATHITATNLVDVSVNSEGAVSGYAPLALTGPAFADIQTGNRVTRLEVATPAKATRTSFESTVYDMTWDGSTSRRKAGSWYEPGTDPLDLPRLPWYDGGGTYRAPLALPDPGTGRVVLDLGAVGDAAAITINGEPMGTRLFPPYAVDVSKVLRDGDDQVSILVKVSKAGGFPNDPQWRSGLLGPVTARAEPLIELGSASAPAPAPVALPATGLANAPALGALALVSALALRRRADAASTKVTRGSA